MMGMLGLQSILLATLVAIRRRAAVLQALAVRPTNSFLSRAAVRALASSSAARATTLERMLAEKAAHLVRSFVQTAAFDQLLLTGITYVRARIRRGGDHP
jgi:hypothetical protein